MFKKCVCLLLLGWVVKNVFNFVNVVWMFGLFFWMCVLSLLSWSVGGEILFCGFLKVWVGSVIDKVMILIIYKVICFIFLLLLVSS